MTRRGPRRPAGPHPLTTAPALRREKFPALESFVRGYLHEDFPAVHGSAVSAAAAFCADATEDERRQLAEELDALARLVARRSVRDLRRFVTRNLGSRWEPASHDELVALLERVRAPR